MLDLSDIPVIDNHCHPMLLEQKVDVLQFRHYFTEAFDKSFAEKHVPNSLHYLWILRQMAKFYHCEADEVAVVAARNAFSAEELLARYVKDAHIGTLMLDLGYPAPEESYSAERMSQMGGCRTARILRLETIMQQLIVAHADFDEVLERFRVET